MTGLVAANHCHCRKKIKVQVKAAISLANISIQCSVRLDIVCKLFIDIQIAIVNNAFNPSWIFVVQHSAHTSLIRTSSAGD